MSRPGYPGSGIVWGDEGDLHLSTARCEMDNVNGRCIVYGEGETREAKRAAMLALLEAVTKIVRGSPS